MREDLWRTDAWISNRSVTGSSITPNPPPVDHASAAIRQQQLLSFVPPEQADQIQQILSQRSGSSQTTAQGKSKNKSKNKKKSSKQNNPQASSGNVSINMTPTNTQSSSHPGTTPTANTSGRRASNQRPKPQSGSNPAAYHTPSNQNLAAFQNLQQAPGSDGSLNQQTGMNFPPNFNPIFHQFWNHLAQQMPYPGLYQPFPMVGPNTSNHGYPTGLPGAFPYPPPQPQPFDPVPYNTNLGSATKQIDSSLMNTQFSQSVNASVSGVSHPATPNVNSAPENLPNNESMITDQQEKDALNLGSQPVPPSLQHGSDQKQVGSGLIDESSACSQPTVTNSVNQTPPTLDEDISVHIGSQVF